MKVVLTLCAPFQELESMILTAPSVQPSDEDFRVDDSYEDTWTSEQVYICPSLSLYISLSLPPSHSLSRSLPLSLSLSLSICLSLPLFWRKKIAGHHWMCISLRGLCVCRFAALFAVCVSNRCFSFRDEGVGGPSFGVPPRPTLAVAAWGGSRPSASNGRGDKLKSFSRTFCDSQGQVWP